MTNHTGVVEEESSFNPNADVPLWINVTIPILLGLFFFLVLFILYRTKKEIPVEKIEGFVGSIPLINKYLTTEWIADNEEKSDGKPRSSPKTAEPASNGYYGEDNPVFTVEDAKATEANGGTPAGISRRPVTNAGFAQSTRL